MPTDAYRAAVVALASQNDEEMLEWIAARLHAIAPSHYVHFALRGVHILQSTPLLACPPTWKQYRGHVGVRPTATGALQFIGFTTFGSVDGSQHGATCVTDDLDEAVAHVNKIVRSKLRKGYVPQSDDETKLTRDSVLSRLARTVS